MTAPTGCRNPNCTGWLGHDDEHRPIPCYDHRPHLRKTVDTNDCDPATRR